MVIRNTAQIINLYRKRAKNNNIKGSVEFVHDPSPIIDYMKSRKFDLVVMGSHGGTGWKKLLLGSVAEGVLNRAKYSVMIVRRTNKD